MPKLQKSGRSDERVSLNIPKEHTDLLGWKQGDRVMISSDKNANTITVTKIKEETK